jgi:hypothetical protein
MTCRALPGALPGINNKVCIMTDHESGEMSGSVGQWVSVAEASVILGCHPRTVERRIAADKIQHRRVGDRVEVWVVGQMPGEMPGNVGHESMSGNVSGDAGQTAETALVAYQRLAGPSIAMAQRMTDQAEAQVTEARSDTRRWRRATMVLAVLMIGTLEATAVVGWIVSGRLSAAESSLAASEQRGDGMAAQLRESRQAASTAQERYTQAVLDAAVAQTRADDLADQLAEARQEQRGGWWSRLGFRMADANQ